MQLMVLIVSLAGMAAIVLYFVSAIRASGVNAPPQGNNEGQRSLMIWGLLVAGLLITVLSLWKWPHDVRAGEGAVTVNVTGAQWYWEIDLEIIPAGTTVLFNVRTKDVNHGMGVVDDSGQLLFQTQSMPGYVNQVRYTFDRPGKYRIICMEFCGVAHHDMADGFEVTAKKS